MAHRDCAVEEMVKGEAPLRILITGNMGYVGPVVIRHLRSTLGHSAEIIGVDSGFFGNCVTLPAWEPLPEAAVDVQHFCDVRAFPEALLTGVDAVVHLAAISNDPMGKRFEAPTSDVNFRSSVSIAHAAAKAGVKTFVFASSCSVYGLAADGNPRCETDPVNPLTAYARSKIDTENALRQADLGDLKVRCLRFATACGMSPRVRLDLVLNDFVAGALTTDEITVLSDGTPWRPLIDVADMAKAIAWAIEPAAYSEPFLSVNVGSDSWNFQVKDIAQAVADISPGTRVDINAKGQPDPRSYRVDFSLWRRLAPDHQPTGTLAESAMRLRKGLLSAGFADKSYRESALIRLKYLEHLGAAGKLGDTLRWAR